MSGRIRIRMSGQLLHDVLQMPEGVGFVAAEVEPGLDMIEFTLAGDDFPEVPEGGAPQLVDPTVTRRWDGSASWDWNLG